MNSKRKGATGERELLEILHEHGINNAVRNDQRWEGGRENPDISASYQGIPLHIECKRVERLNLYNAICQAVSDSAGKTFPVVVHRMNRQPWIVSFRLDDFFKFVSGQIGHPKRAREDITAESPGKS